MGVALSAKDSLKRFDRFLGKAPLRWRNIKSAQEVKQGLEIAQ